MRRILRLSDRAILPAVTSAVLLLAGSGCSDSTSAKDRGKALYRNCLQCHQKDAGGSDLAQAPNLSGMGAWYLEAQIIKFRDGVRGAHPDDVEGLKMRPMARTLTSTDDIRVVAQYIGSLPPVAPKPTKAVNANPERGRALFQTTCVTCHGDKAQGNETMGAPRLAGHYDWYLVSQLNKFRSGIRGADPADTTGSQMRAMAMSLPDEQAVRVVAAYVSSLK